MATTPLTVTIGATVTAVVDGHSAVNGANMPAGSSVVFASTDATVATVANPPNLAADTATFSVPVTIVTTTGGSTTLTCTLTLPDGTTTFTDTATLIVAPAVAGLTHVTLTLTSP